MLRDELGWAPGPTRGVVDAGTRPADVNWRGLIEEVISGARPHSIVAQPIVDLQRRKVAGYEALSRFTPPYPGCGTEHWFDAAHQVGLAGPLEALTLSAALDLRDQLPRNCFLSINLDPESMLTAEVRATLAHAGSLLGVYFEMTEHQRLDHFRLAGTLAWLRSRGAQIAVDDAGAGHSGLRQILEIRPELLKLDRSLVDGVDGNDSKVALIETMVLLAGRIDASLLAEGVQTVAEARRLTELGVGLAQGYVFAQPGPPWPEIRADVVGNLSPAGVAREPTLEPLLDRETPLNFATRAATRAAHAHEEGSAVIDDDQRPLGMASPASGGQVMPALVVNVGIHPAELAAQLATTTTPAEQPSIAVDNAGLYLGLVRLPRLLDSLSHLSRRTGHLRS